MTCPSSCCSPHGGHLTTLPFFPQGPLYALSELENKSSLLHAQWWKERGCQSHTLGTSLQTKHAHLHAKYTWITACQNSEVTPQFPPHISCPLLLTAFSAPPYKILPGLINLKRAEEKLHYAKQTQQTP